MIDTHEEYTLSDHHVSVIADLHLQAAALRRALLDLELSANTAALCYTRRPENFAAALSDLLVTAAAAREVLNP